MRIFSLELNLKETFKDTNISLSDNFSKVQLAITNTEEFNEQNKSSIVEYASSSKSAILENRSKLLRDFSIAVIVINRASVNKKRKTKKVV